MFSAGLLVKWSRRFSCVEETANTFSSVFDTMRLITIYDVLSFYTVEMLKLLIQQAVQR